MLPSRSRLEGWSPDSLTFTAAAPTPADKCVSLFAGTFALAGNAAGGAAGAFIGGAIPVPGVQVVAVPVLAVGGSIAAGEWMKSIGTKVGEVLCGA